MTAYEQSMAELVRRVEAMEAWNREGGVLYNHGTKLSNLEDQHEEDRSDFIGRLEALEAFASLIPETGERLRQDRWHATYNAALMSALGSFDGWSVETLHEHSVECADLAHGPLEAKAAAVIPPIEHASWKMFADPRVEALVKAVLEACDYALPDEVMALLTKAVEPFEREQKP